ncbi:MAG: chromosomal replication initiator protein DnaA [Clostridia bacterium]|nr:chromosomal replication initiator protein DnaA [Clostridia bacterium]
MSVWEDCLDILENDNSINSTTYNIMLKNMNEIKYEPNKYIILSCRDEYCLRFMKNNNNGIKDIINSVINMVCGGNINVQFVREDDVKSIDTVVYALNKSTFESNDKNTSVNTNIYFNPQKLSEQNKYFTFDTFIPGESNRFARASAMQVADNPGYVDYNPFYLWGNSGLGKTHLLYAIANKIYENNPNLNIIYTECQSFVDEYVLSSKKHSYSEFRSKYANADVLLIDDIQYLIGKMESQNEFFNTFNNLIKAGKQIVISSDKSPNYMPELDERLTSRFSQGITMDIQPPNYETRKAILLSKCEADNIVLDDEFINFFCENFTSSIRRLLGAYTTYKTYTNVSTEKIDFDTFKKIMQPLVSPNKEDTLSPDFIANKVCNYFSANYYNVTVDKLKSDSRAKNVTEPRNICIYFFVELLHMTYSEIGNYFGGRKHSTMLHSYNIVQDALNAKKMDIVTIVDNISKEFK